MNTTLQDNQNVLPEEWITKLFIRFTGMYGSKFVDLWNGCDIANVKAIWAEDLRGFSGEEIRRGLDSCKTRTFPPTLPEFVSLCRPPIDYETAFHHAVKQMHNRRSGNHERWNSRAVYWAAASIGGDIQQPYATIKTRWKLTLDEFIADEPLPEIPGALPMLPAPSKQKASKEIAKATTEIIKSMTCKPKDCMAHWRDVRDRHHAGVKFPHITLQYCRDALENIGESFDKQI